MADEIVTKELAHDTSNATIARLANQRTKFRGAAAKLTGERDTARTELATARADLVEAQKHAGAAAELAALKETVKNDKHRGKFDELARAAGAKAKALDDLWERSGYKTDGDVPNEKAMGKLIEAQREARDYLFEAEGTTAATAAGDEEEGDESPQVPELGPARPGPARGQGGTRKSTGSQAQFQESNMRDPEWVFANAAKLQAAAKAAGDLPIGQVGSKFTII
jgi:hypothetical protein